MNLEDPVSVATSDLIRETSDVVMVSKMTRGATEILVTSGVK